MAKRRRSMSAPPSSRRPPLRDRDVDLRGGRVAYRDFGPIRVAAASSSFRARVLVNRASGNFASINSLRNQLRSRMMARRSQHVEAVANANNKYVRAVQRMRRSLALGVPVPGIPARLSTPQARDMVRQVAHNDPEVVAARRDVLQATLLLNNAENDYDYALSDIQDHNERFGQGSNVYGYPDPPRDTRGDDLID